MKDHTHAALEVRLRGLQAEAFARYEVAAQRAEQDPRNAQQHYAEAERDTAPLIAEAALLNEQRVRRLRIRARRWRYAAIVIAVIGACAVVWLLAMRR